MGYGPGPLKSQRNLASNCEHLGVGVERPLEVPAHFAPIWLISRSADMPWPVIPRLVRVRVVADGFAGDHEGGDEEAVAGAVARGEKASFEALEEV